MQDTDIIALYFARSEDAIAKTGAKYGPYLHCIAYHILGDASDAEEVVDDTYMAAWEAMPPERPRKLKHFLSRITRNLSFKRLEYNTAGKRSPDALALLDELAECIPGKQSIEDMMEARQMAEVLNRFLATLAEEDVRLFAARYYYAMPLRDISRRYAIPMRKVQYRLSVMRSGLRAMLEKEGIEI